jgi:tetratricopeptide (TPR) repeat protein
MVQLLDVDYQIVKVLSEKQQTKTYLVEKTNDSITRLFIVKQLNSPKEDKQTYNITLSLLKGEAESLGNLGKQHEQIQKVFTFTEKNQEFYLLQEFIAGNPLSEEILPEKPLSEEQVINILSEVLEILVFVHSRGIIHKNIKAKNIIRREEDQKLVLIDFGAVKQAVTNIIGSPEFIPLEQLYGNPQYNSDIYALGIVSIVALTSVPASEISGAKSRRSWLTGEIIWRHYRREINPKLAKIINKMVRTDYRNRYQSAQSVLNDLKKLQQKQQNWQLEQLSYQDKLWLIVTAGIVSFIAIGVIAWLFITPNSLDAAMVFYQKGVTNYEQANYKGAIQNFSEAIKINTKYAQAYNRRGDAYYRLGNYEKAQQDSSEAIRLNPADANAYYDRGFAQYNLGNYNGAILDYNQALELEPQYADAYYARGLTRSKTNDKLRAKGDFSKAIALNYEFVQAYIQRGITRRQLGEKIDAIKDFSEAISISPEIPEIYYERAKAHYAMNEKQKAVSDYTKAIELNNKYLEAYIGRGNAYTDLVLYNQAIEDYNEALKIDSKSVEGIISLGNFRFALKDINAAIEQYNKAIAINPKQESAYNFRGIAYLNLGEFKKAVADYSKAIAINPDYAMAYYNRGLLLTDLGKVPQAVEDFQKAADIFKEKGEQESYNDAITRIKALSPNS